MVRLIKPVPVLALVLALAAIGAHFALERRSSTARDAEVTLAQAETDLARLQGAPFRAHESTGGSPAIARKALTRGKQQVSDALAKLQGDSPPAALEQLAPDLRANYATLQEIFVIGSASGYGREADRLAAVAAGSSARVSQLLHRARSAYHERAVRSDTQATAGSAAGILLLLCAFAFFFRRSERLARDNEELLAASRTEALTDALTGLGNRRALEMDLEARLPAPDSDKQLLIALFDLDGFKQYNDTFGHPAGDALLARFGARLAATVQGRGSAYRVGGDEFCLLARADDDRDAIVAAAAAALTDAGGAFEIGCSYGTVLTPSEASVAPEALNLADQRMYGRKAGRMSASRQSADVLLQVLSERGDGLADHGDDVASLAQGTAERLGLSAMEIGRVHLAAELHDVGKSAIPDAILNKPGKLEPDEWEFIRSHTLVGERIVLAAPSLAHTADLVRSSHEWVNGSGYPDGLRGAEIPIGARIIAVCDAYAAMTTDRPYSPETSTFLALTEIRRCAGTQFDGSVAEAFCALVEERELEPARA